MTDDLTSRTNMARLELLQGLAAQHQRASRRADSGQSQGRRSGAFAAIDWALLAGVAAMWGSSFLFIDVGVDHLRPELLALLRLAFGVATLAAIPAARRAVPRSSWPAIALLGVVWMAVPFMLFPVAQQWIDSSLAGMLNAAAPLFTAVIAALMARRLPPARQQLGLLIGILGVVAVSWPYLGGAHATAVGAGLMLLATLLYGVAFNLAAPLEERHGALPVIWRAEIVALVLVAPAGLASVPDSSFAWSSLLAVAALGCLGTALAFAAFTTLVGRVGSTRASVTVYFLPPVAIALGALARDEAIAAASLLGAGFVVAGAYLTSRNERRSNNAQRQQPLSRADYSRELGPAASRSAGGLVHGPARALATGHEAQRARPRPFGEGARHPDGPHQLWS
jgi:drug/metabolite transporter (DMT)-like permease